MDMKLEVVGIPVTDVDAAKAFYTEKVGFNLDHDIRPNESMRVVGAVLPLAPSPSDLPYSVENLRLCGCSLEQLVQKDLNDCPHCGRRLPAVER